MSKRLSICIGSGFGYRFGFGFVWVWFYGISTIVDYLMPNPDFTRIFNDQTVIFLTLQFSISKQSQMVPSIAMYH